MPEKKQVTGVKSIIYDAPAKKSLLLKRSKALLFGKYDTAGGQMESSDETYDKALLREIIEELGISPEVAARLIIEIYQTTNPDLASLFPNVPILHSIELTLITCIVKGIDLSTALTLQEGEISEAIWADIHTVAELARSGEMLPVLADQILEYMRTADGASD